MADLNPYLRLDVATDKVVYGIVKSVPQEISWNLAGLFGKPDTSSQNLVPDPTGQYLIQQPAYIPVAAGPAQWTADGAAALPLADTGDVTKPIFAAGTDETKGVTLLRQVRGGPSVTFPAVFDAAHDDDEGFALSITRGGPVTQPGAVIPGPADFNFYIELNFARGVDSFGLPQTGLRLCAEAGNPIRLETSDDDITWTTVDVASELGDSEAYLTAKKRALVVDVCPLTSSDYWDDLENGDPASTYGKPPDLVAVTIGGGDATLVYQAEGAQFPAGQVRLSGKGGQWNALYALRRYRPAGSLSLPEQQRWKPFATAPQGRMRGFLPFPGQVTVAGQITAPTAATAAVSVITPSEGLDTQAAISALVPGGAAILTAVLSTAILDFPGVFQGPTAVPDIVSYTPFGFRERCRFDQSGFGIRSMETCYFAQMPLAPGSGVIPAVRAAALYRGFTNDAGYNDACYGFWGFSGLGSPGYRWYRDGALKCFALDILDGWRENVPILWMEPWDDQCLYCIARELGYKMGLTDDFMPFPYCQRDSDCPHYRLPAGTTKEPIFGVPPTMLAGQALRFLRANAGERDPVSGQVQPMYLFFDRARNLQFFPMPIGLVNIFADPSYDPVLAGLAQSKVFSNVPQFSAGVDPTSGLPLLTGLDTGLPVLNEFVSGTLESRVTLDNIRTDVILAGQRPTDGAFLTGFNSIPALGGGDEGDVNAWGYVGVSTPYVDINKLYASPEAVEVALANAVAQTSFPATTTDFSAYFQSDLTCLDTIGVIDPWSQGTDQSVPYYVTGTDSHMMLQNEKWDQGTVASGHLLGQAGD